MEKETVSTLRSPEWYQSGRMSGNTTRQIDLAIQLFFEGKRVLLHDHYEDGNHEKANKNFFNRVIDRLVREHRIEEGDVKFTKIGVYWAIELKEKNKKMKDRLISFETAKLAKERGFGERVFNYFKIGAISKGLIEEECTSSDINFQFKERSLWARPTQTHLQRWLREKKGIHICVIPTVTSFWTFKIITVISERDKDVIIGIKSVSDLPPYKEVNGYDYSTYEAALEEGLQEALKQL